MYPLPPIQKYVEARQFLADFLALNQPKLTHRKFAKALGWPISLLGDLLAGRRTISIARAVEFARHFEMNSIDTERLVVLALKEAESDAVRDYAHRFLTVEGARWPDLLEAPVTDLPPTAPVAYLAPEFLTDHLLGSLLIFLIWREGRATVKEIGDFLYLAPELNDPEILDQKLSQLRELGLVTGSLPNVEICHRNTSSPGMTRKQIFASLDALRPLTEIDAKRTHWQLSRVVFPRAHYQELNQRFRSLWNWIKIARKMKKRVRS